MAEIFTITLRSDHESRLRFHHSDGAFRGGSSVLRVRNGCGGSWNFNCRSEGGGWFSISGSGRSDFFNSYSVDDIVTLSIEAGDDIYAISVH